MRIRTCALAAALLAWFAIPADGRQGQLPSQAAGSTARIVGRVLDPQTGAGRAFVQVELVGEGRVVSADSEGRFDFGVVPAGRHTLVARLPGYEPSPPRTVDTGDAAETTVDLELRLNIVADVRALSDIPEPAPVASAVSTLLDARQITTQPGAVEDVFRVLQMSPGVTAVDDNRNDLLVRGAGPIESEIRVDGFSIPNASHFAGQGGTAGGISLVSPWLIDRASVQPGGFSAAYGERASSVVDLSLRAGSRTRVGGTAAAGVGGGWATVEGPMANGRGDWLASVRRSFLEFVIDQTEEDVRPQYFDAVAKLDLALSSRHRLELLVLGSQDNVVTQTGSDNFETFHDNQRIGLAGLSLASPWSGRASSRLAFSVAINDLSVVSRDRRSVDFSDDSREAEMRVTGEVTRAIGSLGTVVAGASIKRADLSFNLYQEGYRNEYNNIVTMVSANSKDTFVDAAAYGEMTASAGPRLRLRGGARVDRSGSSRDFRGSPRLRGEYQIARGVKLTGAWGIYRQSIPYIWIGSSPENAGLDRVRSRQIVAGIDVAAWKGTRVLVEGFEKRYSNYPVDPVAPARVLISALADFESPFVGTLVSVGRVRAAGLDSIVSSSVGAHLKASLSYSLWKVTQAGLDGIWRAGDYDIRHQARVACSYGTETWNLGASWRYASGRPYTPYNVAASVKARTGRYDLTKVNADRYPPYHRLDVRAERVFRIGHVRLAGYAEVDNVYGRANIYVYKWDNTLKSPKAVDQWGLTPLGGIRVMF